MKWLMAIIAAGLVSLMIVLYVVLFTGFGNNLVSSLVATRLNQTLGQPVAVEKFHLRLGQFAFDLALDEKNRVETEGTFSLLARSVDARYRVSLEDLERLKPLTRRLFKGRLYTEGTVKGTLTELVVDGSSDLAASNTRFHALVTNFKPRVLTATIEHLKLKDLLELLAMPPYAEADLDVAMAIDDARTDSLKGTVATTLSKGVVNGATMAREFELKMPKTNFSAKTNSVLQGENIDTEAVVDSSLANLKVKKARFHVADATLVSDYLATVPDLDKLYFVTNRRLKGAMAVNGEIRKGKDLTVTAHSDTLGGTFDATLQNNDVHADLKGLQTMAMLEMLTYPQVFKSGLTGVFDYNIKSKKGKLDADLSDGQFAANLMTSLVAQLARFDLTAERFQGSLTSNLDDKKILSDLALKSRNASVTGNGIALDNATRQIDGRLDIVANDNPIAVTIRGDVAKPKVNVDAKALIQREAQKLIEKQTGGQVKSLLKGLFQ